MSDVFANYKPSGDVFAPNGVADTYPSPAKVKSSSTFIPSPGTIPFDLSELIIGESATDFEVNLTRDRDSDDDPYYYTADISPDNSFEGSGESFESNNHDTEQDAIEEIREKLVDEKSYVEEQVRERKQNLIDTIIELREVEKALKAIDEHKISRDW
jgi:hypothetical protein